MYNKEIINDINKKFNEVKAILKDIEKAKNEFVVLFDSKPEEMSLLMNYDFFQQLGLPLTSNEDFMKLIDILETATIKQYENMEKIVPNLITILSTEEVLSFVTSQSITIFLETYEKIKEAKNKLFLLLLQLNCGAHNIETMEDDFGELSL